MEESKSSISSKTHDPLRFSSESWGFRQKRYRPTPKEDKKAAPVNSKGQEIKAVESAAEEDETDLDEESTMLESLNELSGSSEHKITRKEKRYLCMSCNINFPTFHAARVHVSEAIGTNTISEVKAAAAKENDGSGSVNQAAEPTGNRKQLEFDLNKLPPMEDDDA